LHRVGRTGRAGASGVAITLVDWQDINRWQMINRMLGMDFNEPVETYSSSDHVYEGLGIQKGTTGELPGSARTREGLAGEKLEDLGETGANKGRRSGAGKPQTGRSGSGAKSNSSNRNSASKPRSTSSGDAAPKATAEKAPAKERTPRQRSRTRGTQKDS
jgi:superfamily II DNA/RNA helicase